MKRSEEILRKIAEEEAKLEKERREYHERTGGIMLKEIPSGLELEYYRAIVEEAAAESGEGKDEGVLSADGADERGLEM